MSETGNASEETVFQAVWGPARSRQRRRDRQTTLSADDICRVALELIDREGLEALTMRRLAQELDASPSALYWYVSSKDELLDRVRDAISAEMRLEEIDLEQDWRAAATDAARRFRGAMIAHPGAALLVATRTPVGPHAIRNMERMLAIFARAGFGPGAIGPAYRAFIDYTMAITLRECLYHDATEVSTVDDQERYELADLLVRHLQPDEFPLLTAFAGELFTRGWNDLFEFGLEQLLAALSPQGAPPAAP